MLQKIRQFAEQHPQKTAYRINGAEITYGALLSQADAAADLLRRQGDGTVILYGHKEIPMIVGILACLIARRTYVPVDVSTPSLRLKSIVSLTGASLILTEQTLCGADIQNVECASVTALKCHANAEAFDCCADIAYIIFTSGSTGEPKGVPIFRRSLNHFAEWICSLRPLCDYGNAVVMNQASFSFDLSVADLCYALCSGHTLVACDHSTQADYQQVFALMQSEKISVTVTTPTFYKLCLTNPEFCAAQFPHLQCAYFCGEILENRTARKLLERFPQLQILNAYGPTEATSAVSCSLITHEIAETQAVLPVGDAACFAADISIRDGEIVLKGESVFHGYLEGRAGGHFIEDGEHCYRTGDLGSLHDGMLFCKGRMDTQVKFKGYRIELSDIEQNILRLDGVRDCVVTAKRNDAQIVKTIQAFVLADPTITPVDIRAALAKRLPPYMIPKTIRILEQFPVNSNGKTDRKALSTL